MFSWLLRRYLSDELVRPIQGPMDRYPTSLFYDPLGECKYSYRVQGDRLRITPPEGGDPFWADYKHSERMKVQ